MIVAMTDRTASGLVTSSGLDAEAERLLSYLREHLDAPALAYAQPPVPILGGFDTRILAFELARAPAPYDGPLIARIFSTPEEAPRASFEAAAQNAIVGLGYPAPPALIAEPRTEAIGLPFVVMRGMRGRVMLNVLVGLGLGRMASLLGRAHARLHGLDASAIGAVLGDQRTQHPLAYTDSYHERQLAYIDEAQLDGLRAAFEWLASHRPARTDVVVCHGDFHPLNVLVEGNAVTAVLDWASATVAPAAFDVGASVALLSHGPVDMPRAALPIIRLFRRLTVRWYLNAYRSVRPIDQQQLKYFEALRLLGFLIEAGATIQGRAGVIAYDRQAAFFAPYVRNGVVRRLQQITGCAVTLPRDRGEAIGRRS